MNKKMNKKVGALVIGLVLLTAALTALVWSGGCKGGTEEGDLIFNITPNPCTGYFNPGHIDKLWDLRLGLENESGYTATLTSMEYKIGTIVDETVEIDPPWVIEKGEIFDEAQTFTSGGDGEGHPKFTSGQLTYILTGTFGNGNECEVIDVVSLQ